MVAVASLRRFGRVLLVGWDSTIARHQALTTSPDLTAAGAARRCSGSGEPVESMRLVARGHAACTTCGLRVLVVHHEDAGSGAWVADHNREVRRP